MVKYSQLIAEHLLQIKAIQLRPQNPFTWASGRLSPIYCDNRITLSYPKIRTDIKEGLKTMLSKDPTINAIAGVATAGIPQASILAEDLGLPLIYVRSKPKQHGRQNLIEGQLPDGDWNIAVIEDLISTGGSSMKAVEALRNEGYKVAGVFAIFTYGLPSADENFKTGNCELSTLTDFNTMSAIAAEKHYIQASDKSILEQWSADPQAWSDERKTN